VERDRSFDGVTELSDSVKVNSVQE
jgi:hypothetical protein